MAWAFWRESASPRSTSSRSRRILSWSVFPIAEQGLMSQEEIHGHENADGDDEAADDLRIEFLGEIRPAVTAQDGAHQHHQGLWPQHGACRDEGDHGRTIDRGIE